MQIPTLDQTVPIKRFIKKFDLPMTKLTFSNGYSIRVAKKHILRQNNKDIFACSLQVGDWVDHQTGQIEITEVCDVEKDACYDIAIDDPHLYYDANGLIHHNTIITAALSERVQKYGRTTVIVPNKDLVTQTEADYRILGLDVGVYFGDRKEHGHQHTICTWQSLNNLLKNSRNAEADITITDFLEGVVCVMVDECFAGDSPVLTPNGYVPIRNLQAGDLVINYCEKTKEFKEDVVVKQHRNLTTSLTERMYRLEFDNGMQVEVTGNHKFFTNLGWCRADELTDQHEIINTLD
jgi:hypothetical protein